MSSATENEHRHISKQQRGSHWFYYEHLRSNILVLFFAFCISYMYCKNVTTNTAALQLPWRTHFLAWLCKVLFNLVSIYFHFVMPILASVLGLVSVFTDLLVLTFDCSNKLIQAPLTFHSYCCHTLFLTRTLWPLNNQPINLAFSLLTLRRSKKHCSWLWWMEWTLFSSLNFTSEEISWCVLWEEMQLLQKNEHLMNEKWGTFQWATKKVTDKTKKTIRWSWFIFNN